MSSVRSVSGWRRDAVSVTVVGVLLLLTATLVVGSADATFPGGNGKIAFSRLGMTQPEVTREIWVVEPDGAGPVPLAGTGGEEFGPAWSPDGRSIAYLAWTLPRPSPTGLYVQLGTDGEPRLVPGTEQLGLTGAPSWSPDGRSIVVVARAPVCCATDLAVVDVETGATRWLTSTPGSEGDPSWSPDGSRVAFVRDGIHVIGADGTGEVRLTNDAATYEVPSWSPDGQTIAFHSDRGGDGFEVWVMGADGGEPTQLTSAEGDSANPVWSPDGSRIAFVRVGGADIDIWTMAADGSGQAQLTDLGGFAVRLSWQSLDRTPPVVTVPGDVVTDATGPGGAGVAFTATAVDALDGDVPVSCLPAPGTTFAIGRTTVECSATDADGNGAAASFVVEVRGASEQLARLRGTVAADTALPRRLRADLLAALDEAASTRLSRACSGLRRFTRLVAGSTAPRGRIAPATAAAWLADAGRIGAVRGCDPFR